VAQAARTVAPSSREHATDGQLLGQFVATHDEAAFAELVRRLGPMVLGVCRRFASDGHLAEDAFQAAFVVLAQRATVIRPREAVRAWLYGVAVRVARKARTMSAQRRTREVSSPTIPDRAANSIETAETDTLQMLDEEIAALPEHLRAAVVLCELDGMSRAEAALRLRIPEGTLSSRLAKARKVLAASLKKRGVVLSAALAMLGNASASVSPELVTRTTSLAFTTGSLPPLIATLSKGALRNMFIHKLKLGFACGFILAIACVVAASDPPTPGSQPSQPRHVLVAAGEAAQPQKPTQATGELLIAREPGQWSVVSADGKRETPMFTTERHSIVAARISRDGKTAACNELTKAGGKDQFGPAGNTTIRLRQLDKNDDPHELEDIKGQNVCWSADGKQLVVLELTQGKDRILRTNWLYDIATDKKKKLDAEDTDAIRAFSPDGKFFLAVRSAVVDGNTRSSVIILDATGKFVRTLIEIPHGSGEDRISPDGKNALIRLHVDVYVEARLSPDGKNALIRLPVDVKEAEADRKKLIVTPVDKPKPVTVGEVPLNAHVTSCCWSPDGKRIAYTWQPIFEKDVPECESFLVICDPDGKNAKTVTSMKATGRGAGVRRGLGVYDWRATAAENPAPKPPGQGRILFFRRDALVTISPDGKGEVAAGPKAGSELLIPSHADLFAPRLSHDGTQVAYFSNRPKGETSDDISRLVVQRLTPLASPTDAGVASCHSVAWAPDGKEIAVSYYIEYPPTPGTLITRHALVDTATWKRTGIDLPKGHRKILDITSAGEFLTLSGDTDYERLHLVDRKGKVTADLSSEGWIIHSGRVSPDGKKVAIAGWAPVDMDKARVKKYAQVLWVKDGQDAEFKRVFAGEKRVFWGVCWSPDGKRIAYGFCDLGDMLDFKLATADPDGANEKIVTTEPHQRFDQGGILVVLDWR
jgi:RNA polymerase sigma factor (sigma-70 family)